MRLLTSAAAAVAMAASVGIVHAQPATPAATPAPAAAQQRTQVPGYYRMALGDDVVTALYDGYVDLPAKTLAVSYTHLTLPTNNPWCRSRWSPYH